MQSIVEFPKTVNFNICGWPISIYNHTVKVIGGLCTVLMSIVKDSKSDRNTLVKFEDHGISFNGVVEYCATELEDNPGRFATIIWGHYDVGRLQNKADIKCILAEFSKSGTGLVLAEKFADKIRDCANWEELYDILHPDGDFQKNITSKIREAIKQWYKI